MSPSAPAATPGGPGADPRPAGRLLRFKGGSSTGGEFLLPPSRLVYLGVWVALVPTLMLFLALVSAYVVRQGLAEDWAPIDIPQLMWVNTAVLLASSLTLELGRRRQGGAFVWGSLLLGCVFLAGQVIAWQQLMESGVGLGTTPHGSFFYVLSGTHAVHVIGGVIALLVAAVWPRSGLRHVGRGTAVAAASIYWHFLGLMWLGLFGLLFFWR